MLFAMIFVFISISLQRERQRRYSACRPFIRFVDWLGYIVGCIGWLYVGRLVIVLLTCV